MPVCEIQDLNIKLKIAKTEEAIDRLRDHIKSLYEKIDQLIYEMYELTSEDLNIIKQNVP